MHKATKNVLKYPRFREDNCLASTERRLVVRSLKTAQTQELALRTRLEKAKKALSQLGQPRRGKKRLQTRFDWKQACDEIIDHYRVKELLDLEYQCHREKPYVRKYGNRPARFETNSSISLNFSVNESALNEQIALFGWRVYATNYPQ
ncbi:MAG: hypothetical protein F6K10_24820 [Moorea sp. SIO2B7]|nr:hypothetical protein [Moorena sp. SIO2B7]